MLGRTSLDVYFFADLWILSYLYHQFTHENGVLLLSLENPSWLIDDQIQTLTAAQREHHKMTTGKSTGGQRPRKTSTHCLALKDHKAAECISVFSVAESDPPLPPLFSFQTYVTFSTDPDIAHRQDLCVKIFNAFTHNPNLPSRPCWRLDVHFLPRATKDVCLAHYRANEPVRREQPVRVMKRYKYGSVPAGGVLVLVDCEEWEEKGVGVVCFDLDRGFLERDRAPGEMEVEADGEVYWENVPVCYRGVDEVGIGSRSGQLVGNRLWDFYCRGPGEYLYEVWDEAREEGRWEW